MPIPVNRRRPYASLFNSYIHIMRICLPSTLGPIEQGVLHDARNTTPIFIHFPRHLPTRNRPWEISPDYHSAGTFYPGAVVFVPLQGEGTILEIVDLSLDSGTMVISVSASPGDLVYIKAPRIFLKLPTVETSIHLRAHTWPRVKRMISSHFQGALPGI
ncbi:hypothetical protein OH77DRAFT_1594604 [Trametes cingulata]|nr:hypothetical protein OH77DRAFT_1594604 [Trametes cingulata]